MKKIHFFVVMIFLVLVLTSCALNVHDIDLQEGTDTEAQNSSTVISVEAAIQQESNCKDNQEENTPKEEKTVLVGYGDAPFYNSLSEMYEKSDYVIYGKVLSKDYEWMSLRINNNSTSPYMNPGGSADDDLTLVTIYEVSITENFIDADCEGKVLKLLVVGGETETTIYKIEGAPNIEVDESYIFFLRKSAILSDGVWLLNNNQSLYSTDGMNIYNVNGDGFKLSFDQLRCGFK